MMLCNRQLTTTGYIKEVRHVTWYEVQSTTFKGIVGNKLESAAME